MVRFTLTNNKTLDIQEAFIYTEGNWDPNNNLLSTGETISTGSSRMFEIADGTYDVRFKLTDGTTFEKTNLAMFGDVDESTEEFDLIDDDLD